MALTGSNEDGEEDEGDEDREEDESDEDREDNDCAPGLDSDPSEASEPDDMVSDGGYEDDSHGLGDF